MDRVAFARCRLRLHTPTGRIPTRRPPTTHCTPVFYSFFLVFLSFFSPANFCALLSPVRCICLVHGRVFVVRYVCLRCICDAVGYGAAVLSPVEQGAGVGAKKPSTKNVKSAKRKAPAASKQRSNPDGGATTGESSERPARCSLVFREPSPCYVAVRARSSTSRIMSRTCRATSLHCTCFMLSYLLYMSPTISIHVPCYRTYHTGDKLTHPLGRKFQT